MEFKNFPYRRWREVPNAIPPRYRLVENKNYKRLMKIIGDATASNKTVDFEHKIINEKPVANQPYDIINVRITD